MAGAPRLRPDSDLVGSIQDRQRIVVVGRTGSGKTTFARALSAALGVAHIELDSLYFEPGFSTVPLDVLRGRTTAAVSGERWVTDGNKGSVRDIVWPRADTLIWLDYPLVISLWRLGKRALWRTSVVAREPGNGGENRRLRQLGLAAKGVCTALLSHRGQRRTYPRLLEQPEHNHLAVIRLRSPRATARWLASVTASS